MNLKPTTTARMPAFQRKPTLPSAGSLSGFLSSGRPSVSTAVHVPHLPKTQKAPLGERENANVQNLAKFKKLIPKSQPEQPSRDRILNPRLQVSTLELPSTSQLPHKPLPPQPLTSRAAVKPKVPLHPCKNAPNVTFEFPAFSRLRFLSTAADPQDSADDFLEYAFTERPCDRSAQPAPVPHRRSAKHPHSIHTQDDTHASDAPDDLSCDLQLTKMSDATASCANVTDDDLDVTPELSSSPSLSHGVNYEACYLSSALQRMTSRQNHYGANRQTCAGSACFQDAACQTSVDFITKIVDKMELKERVLFLAIDLLYLCMRTPALCHTEPTVASLTAIWMAAKYEDAWAPFVNGFFKLESVASLKPRMAQLEAQILQNLDYNLNLVLVYDFYICFARLNAFPAQATAFGTFLLNSLLSFRSLHCCDKRAVAMNVCRLVAAQFRLPVPWTTRTLPSKRLLVVPVTQSFGLRASHHLESTGPLAGDQCGRQIEITFDFGDLDAAGRELRLLIGASADAFGTALRHRYDSPRFFQVARIKLDTLVHQAI